MDAQQNAETKRSFEEPVREIDAYLHALAVGEIPLRDAAPAGAPPPDDAAEPDGE